MSKKQNDISKRQKETIKIIDDRIELLDTVKEIVNIELDKREQEKTRNKTYEHSKSKCCSLWKRILDFLSC